MTLVDSRSTGCVIQETLHCSLHWHIHDILAMYDSENRTAFNMTDFERLQEEAEEEHRLKQQKDLIKKEKGQRGKKRKTDADDIKENKAVKTRRRKKSKQFNDVSLVTGCLVDSFSVCQLFKTNKQC